MFIVFLKMTAAKDRAGAFVEGHRNWLKKGFADGVFLVAGSLEGGIGGCLLAHNEDRDTLARRVDEDPFVAEGIVTVEIIEYTPTMTSDRLAFLKPSS